VDVSAFDSTEPLYFFVFVIACLLYLLLLLLLYFSAAHLLKSNSFAFIVLSLIVELDHTLLYLIK